MTKKLFSHPLAFLQCLFFLFASGQSIAQTVNQSATVTWVFNQGTSGQTATYTDSNLWKPDYVTEGGNLSYNGTETGQENSITFTRFTPTVKNNTPTINDIVSFNITPLTGLNFDLTNISFNCERFGTGGGLIDVVWKSSDGTLTTLQTGIKPDRRSDNTYPDATYDVNIPTSGLSIPTSNAESSLYIYIYAFDPTKSVGIANIEIQGNLSGTVINIPQYTITTSSSPSEGGNVSSDKPLTADEGSVINLTANANFGFEFNHWEDELGNQISTANPLEVTVTENAEYKALFNQLTTYSLDVNVTGGASEYMVDIFPEGEIIDGKRMYVSGTNVTLTANELPILAFSNWANGETSSELNVNMDGNKTITSNYNATDYIAGWDFYNSGNAGRIADFSASTINETAALVLRKADNTQSSWLDKSFISAGGYEGQNAAVNWNPLTDKYYYQISFDASDYTDISVEADMLLNYNGYSKQFCEYSIDGTNFTQIGVIDIVATKVWYNGSFSLPSDANNQSKVYIRWIPDYSSSLIGATASNDGTAISEIYVFGTESVFDDGVPPALTSTIPNDNANGASATGKIVLNFDERVKIADNAVATLGANSLTPEVFGKSISFSYSGLDYNTTYSFNLPANVISDLTDNILTENISINFTTLNKPTVIKKPYDFIVGIDGDFAAALTAAQTASSSGERFYIFFPNGEYDLGNTTGDATQQTFINIPNVSFIGQSADGVILFNEPSSADEGIGTTPTINFQSNSTNIYLQDLTILNKMDYRKGAFTGRAVAVRDQGDKNIYKNVKLLSNQDTFYTQADRIYLENSEIHGTVDFIFGDGDVFFNSCDIFLEDRSGNHITAAATTTNWGYVFRDCTIDGFSQNNGSYKLGRPWHNSPKVVFINTIMKQLPTSEGWSEWGGAPEVYAEYNSLTSSGVPVDLSGRKTTYNYTDNGGGSVTIDPVLTESQANNYSITSVLGGSDNWQPKLYTEQANTPTLSNSGSNLTWENSDYVLGWAIFKNNIFLDFVTTNNYDISEHTEGVFTVRAANEMGGLSDKSIEFDAQTLSLNEAKTILEYVSISPNPTSNFVKLNIAGEEKETTITLYNIAGQKLWVNEVSIGNNNAKTINLDQLPKGLYLIKIERDTTSKTVKIIKK
ncbi:pectinesterase family protein [Aestuariibaculum sp. YM273]|uniref:pectinesterase family protein n=1 Tax=Aestuariibaculum sp. YM273 TaxID=3070659 RepID=UPI0027DB9CF1|nr:pectinesterase family protein [Aestuariibaculum sp. YM273]WMI65159.1 pectinesterase family protein [Aestuariibaculum sp. YM273]